MARWVRIFLGVLYAAVLVGAPYGYHRFQETRYRNFRVVTPGVLYRSGQLNEAGLLRLIRDHGIGTILTFRIQDGSAKKPSRWEEEFCEGHGIRHVRVSGHEWWNQDVSQEQAVSVEKFLDVIRDPKTYPRPILVHCYAGVHRAGAYCAIYRMEFEGWSIQEAVEEMKECGFDDVRLDSESHAINFLLRYRPTGKVGIRDERLGITNETDLPNP